MAYLYRNVIGREVKAHSHSGGADWGCPKKYFYKRIQGWQSREDRVSTFFGKAVESAIQFHHNKAFEPGSGIDEFKTLWFQYKDDDSVQYSEKSGNWNDHYQMGTELLGLYESTVQDYPITNAKFQVEKRVDLFNASESSPYTGLQYTSKVDMLCTADNNHPLLPRGPEGTTRDFIVDIKTSSYPYFTDPRLAALDDQLRDYAWVFGIPTVAFLVLVKNFSAIEAGDWITVLKGPKVGKKYIAFDNSTYTVVVLTKSDYDEYSSRKKAIKGKGAKEAKESLFTEYYAKAITFDRNEVTKQRIQFLPAVISPEDMQEARMVATHESMEIADASRNNFFPKKPGVRFPNNVCQNCECLGLCIGDTQLVKQTLVKIDGVF